MAAPEALGVGTDPGSRIHGEVGEIPRIRRTVEDHTDGVPSKEPLPGDLISGQSLGPAVADLAAAGFAKNVRPLHSLCCSLYGNVLSVRQASFSK